LFCWSMDSDLNFNLKKFVQLSFKHNFNTTFTMGNTPIPHVESHKDLGLILSEDLSWSRHYKFIITSAYKILGLICRTFASNHSPATLVKLYTSLVRSQLLYCTQLWCPYLMKDILYFEQIQCRSTKHILSDYTSGYKDHGQLTKIKLFPLMYLLELQDILFAVKSIKTPTNQFCITNYIALSTTNTRSSASNKLIHPRHLNNVSRHSYFHQLHGCSGMLCLKFIIKHKLIWNHFLRNFNDNINCSYHFLCPCSRCHQSKPPTTNLYHL